MEHHFKSTRFLLKIHRPHRAQKSSSLSESTMKCIALCLLLLTQISALCQTVKPLSGFSRLKDELGPTSKELQMEAFSSLSKRDPLEFDLSKPTPGSVSGRSTPTGNNSFTQRLERQSIFPLQTPFRRLVNSKLRLASSTRQKRLRSVQLTLRRTGKL